MKQNIYTMQEHLHSTNMTSNKHGQLLKIHYRKKHHCKTTDKFLLSNRVVTDFDKISNDSTSILKTLVDR